MKRLRRVDFLGLVRSGRGGDEGSRTSFEKGSSISFGLAIVVSGILSFEISVIWEY